MVSPWNIRRVAESVAPDVQTAAREGAGIVYMGHGNEFFPGNGGANLELAAVMETLRLYGIKKVILKPFMIVAGDHSMNDMAGDEADSWKSVLQKNGFEVVVVVARGLGENEQFADIFVTNIEDSAIDAGILLK